MINIGPKCKLALVDVVRFPYFFKIISPPTKSIKKTGIVDEVASCISYRLWVNFFGCFFGMKQWKSAVFRHTVSLKYLKISQIQAREFALKQTSLLMVFLKLHGLF